ncbi:Spo0E like sporulation regulatory protein [Ruminiclostridium hungatei]|uniref:Spo0E like sporulation regulatory protein n=1 Tax=Ruminiclostridium hungatei TaxID=48256 RepID=A0A1V4SIX5_RUMHU|nr:aspartyl-phosphate phosphatase Spo0E family protein [Ruminiclostridium hungatei]OPX43839.1 Spo0E like sporulation regulatory protein [Ruminiclostridium hungatei]
MSELNNLMNDIEKLRKKLHDLINEKNVDLADPEIITASQMLNAAITKYTEIISNKTGR